MRNRRHTLLWMKDLIEHMSRCHDQLEMTNDGETQSFLADALIGDLNECQKLCEQLRSGQSRQSRSHRTCRIVTHAPRAISRSPPLIDRPRPSEQHQAPRPVFHQTTDFGHAGLAPCRRASYLADRTNYGRIDSLSPPEIPGMNVSEVATVARFTVDCLDVLVYENRALAGRAAAQAVAASIAARQRRSGTARVVFAAAPSQDEFMAGLVADKNVDWTRVVAFHMDEYLGVDADHPASFRRYLQEHLFRLVGLKRQSVAADPGRTDRSAAADLPRVRRSAAEQSRPTSSVRASARMGTSHSTTPRLPIFSIPCSSRWSGSTQPAAHSRSMTAASPNRTTFRLMPTP